MSAGFALRLIQVHFCFIYMAAGLSKLKGGDVVERAGVLGRDGEPRVHPDAATSGTRLCCAGWCR